MEKAWQDRSIRAELRPTLPVRSALALTVVLLVRLGLGTTHATESIRFHHLGLEDGLSQSSVNCIVQDPQGRMWFGTQDGLNRFDGYGFDVFRHVPGDAGSLGSNFVWDILIDSAGTLWVGTESAGLNRWNPADDTFTAVPTHTGDPVLPGHDDVRAIAEGPPGILWVGTEGGLFRHDVASATSELIVHDPQRPGSLAGNDVRSVKVARDGTLWIGMDGAGIDRRPPGADRFIHYRHDPDDPESLSDDRVRVLREDSSGAIWVGTYEHGLNRLDPEIERFQRLGPDPEDPGALSHGRVRSIFVDDHDRVWVATDDGLNRLRQDGAGFDVFHRDGTDPDSLSSDRVLSLHQDRGGLLWVATQGGLDRFNPTPVAFSHIRQQPDSDNTLSTDIITSITSVGDETLWIGTYGGGLNRLDRATGSFRHLVHSAENPRSLSDDRVMSLFTDRQQRLWVGTMAGGLNRLTSDSDGSFERWVRHDDDPGSLSANGVTSIHQDSRDRIWVGTYGGGLNLLQQDGRRFRRFKNDPEDPATLSHDRVMVLHEDRDGMLWIGTAGGGLNRLDPESGRIDRLRNDPADRESLSSDLVLSIHEAPDGVMWIGTRGGGLNRWDPEDRAALRNRFEIYNEADGLPNSVVYGILEDDLGRLWMSTNLGISRFDPRTRSFSNFDETHGLQSNEFNFGAFHRSGWGEMLFGGNHGYNAFVPSEIGRNSHVPPVLLTGILKLNERVHFDQPTWNLERLELSYSDDVVSFEFAALDFTAPDQNHYAYKLEGFDRDWIDLGGMRRATYTNLDAGDYVLRVRGSNNDGLWNEDGVTLPVRVLPPPWQTWWAYTLYSLTLLGVVASFLRAQARKLRREEEYSRKLERQVRERTVELAERNGELAEANAALEETSLTDSLTGLRNRRYMMTYIQDDIALVDRKHQGSQADPIDPEGPRDFTFLMIDLDGFKPINDLYGHSAGDLTLIAVRDRLRAVCRQSDSLIRWGGDEFLLVARDANREAAMKLAERIRETIATLRIEVGGGNSVGIGCSIGFAFYPFMAAAPTALSWERVLAVADRALYLAKEHGRNAWVGIFQGRQVECGDPVESILASPLEMAARGVIRIESNLDPERLLHDENATADRARERSEPR